MIDLQRNTLSGQLAVGRGSVLLDATLTADGPQGRLNLGVPDQFAVSISSENGTIASTICGVVGPQEITLRAAQLSGLHIEFQNAAENANACGPASTGLTMAPYIGAVQVTPPPAATTVQQDGTDLLRRFFVLVLIAGLLFVFAPGISTPLLAAARTAPWSRLGLGLGAIIVVPVVGVLIFVLGLTLGLWWLGLLVLMAFALLLAGSLAMAGLVLGAFIVDRLQGRIPSLVGFVLGLLLLVAFGVLPLLGLPVTVVALVYGAGALLLLPRTHQAQAAVSVIPDLVATDLTAQTVPQPPPTSEPTHGRRRSRIACSVTVYATADPPGSRGDTSGRDHHARDRESGNRVSWWRAVANMRDWCPSRRPCRRSVQPRLRRGQRFRSHTPRQARARYPAASCEHVQLRP